MAKPEAKTISVSVGGKEMTFETGRIARQADGAVMVRLGDTQLLTTACSAPSPDNIDFFPLRVDYTEKFSSAGKTLGGFLKREGRPTEREVLICRLTDRPIRPMFEDGYFDEVQLITTVLSYDGVNSPDPLAICGASAALVLSSIPLIKPLAGVRVAFIDDQFIINPTLEEQALSRLDLILAGTEDAILMIEGFCDFLTEEQVLEAIEEGHSAIKTICRALSDWQKELGKEKNRSTLRHLPDGLEEEVDGLLKTPLLAALKIAKKEEREAAMKAAQDHVVTTLLPEGTENPRCTLIELKRALKNRSSHHMRQMILKDKVRCDGRKEGEVRPIYIDLDPLARTHGSVLFTRGETQTIAVCTLGPEDSGQRFETLDEASVRRFYLQYGFPPYSVGEVGRLGSPGRREVGHGKLAEKSLLAVKPSLEEFPYTIRLESNITESNGSSSMASVCGGCLAMMRAGVPVKRPIAGIAMGLILEENSYAILSDILGVEDALGDMDFKITGDDRGITAFQLDIKIEGIDKKIMEAALSQAKEGRIHILNKMLEVCPESSKQISQYAPKIDTMKIKPSKIGTVIGTGGKQIRQIIEETGCQIDINDEGIVSFASTDANAIAAAKEWVYNLTAEVERDQVITGKIVSIKEFGLFVQVLSQEGLCHISEVSNSRIKDLNDVFKVGDSLIVKVMEINERGQIRLSHKAYLNSVEKEPAHT